jgi:hypothetical protein
MKYKQKFGLVLGMIGLAVSGSIVSGQAAAVKCTSEECACEEALRQNTVEALEAFLREYPQSGNGTSACAALSVPSDALDPSTSENTDEDTVPDSQSASGN